VFKTLSASRQYRNQRSVTKILEWSASRGHPAVDGLSAFDMDDFLSQYANRPATRFDMRSMWNMLFDTAIYARWIKESPLPKGKWKTPKPREVAVWTSEDVQRYADQAKRMRQPGLAALIVTMMEIGQRLGDMRTAQWGREFLGDRFVIRQSKTGKLVNIPVPQWLRDLLLSVRIDGSPFVFNDFDKQTGFTPYRLMTRFEEVRHALSQDGDKKLELRVLRHSCVCRLMEAGLSAAEIAGITGHLLARVHSILERYYPDRWGMAQRGMMRAHIAGGADPESFGQLKPLPIQDWLGDSARSQIYESPQYTERNVERLLAAKTGQHRSRATLAAIGPFMAGDHGIHDAA